MVLVVNYRWECYVRVRKNGSTDISNYKLLLMLMDILVVLANPNRNLCSEIMQL